MNRPTPWLLPLLTTCAITITAGAADPAAPAVRVLEGHHGSVMCVAWSPDGKTLASGSRDDRILLWDSVAGKVEREVTGHTSVRLWDLTAIKP